jgi:hypothetical protein
MRLIRLGSLIRPLFLVSNRQVCIIALVRQVSNILHVDLVATMMIFGLVTFAKIKLHPPSFINRSAIHRATTRLSFLGEVVKLGGSMWV